MCFIALPLIGVGCVDWMVSSPHGSLEAEVFIRFSGAAAHDADESVSRQNVELPNILTGRQKPSAAEPQT
jgi:hypothetical protein